MTEAEWAECREPQTMLDWLRATGKLSERKARLFGAACCRTIWPLLDDERSRQAVDAVEQYLEGQAGTQELGAAQVAAGQAREAARDRRRAGSYASPEYPINAAAAACFLMPDKESSPVEAILAVVAACSLATLGRGRKRQKAEKAAQAALLRDIFGNPFHPPPPLDPAWLAWGGGTVRRLAEAAYEERELPSGHLDPARLAVLADALEEAGCTEADLLDHLRGSGFHVRGCHVLDLLLGRE